MTLTDLLFTMGWAFTRNEARRLVSTGGVKVNGVVVNDPKHEPAADDTIQCGRYIIKKM